MAFFPAHPGGCSGNADGECDIVSRARALRRAARGEEQLRRLVWSGRLACVFSQVEGELEAVLTV